MKTPSLSGSLMAVLFSMAMPAAVNAQNSSIQFTSIQHNSGSIWLGTSEHAYSRMNLVWQIAPVKIPVRCEVEYSTDMVHFVSAGEVGKPITGSDYQRRFSFQHNTSSLPNARLIQYRIKLIDVTGKVTYSEVKTTDMRT